MLEPGAAGRTRYRLLDVIHEYGVELATELSEMEALHRSHAMQPWVGQVLYWCPTPWRAVQEAAWRALSTPFAGIT